MFVKSMLVAVSIALVSLPALPSAAAASTAPHAGMLRYPDVSASDIAFVYADDVWLVPRTGGEARPLASPAGREMFPRFSPDGRTIAFMGNYDGDLDLYTVPVAGGVPFRVTHHPTTEMLSDWTADGRLLFAANGLGSYPREAELWSVAATGGLPTALPVPYGANASLDPAGEWLAYTPHARDFATWKRYRGGDATDVWLFHLTRHESRRITTWEGTDTQPMWRAGQVWYLSDAGPAHRLNIWVYDPATETRRQVTRHADHDVKWPSDGPGDAGQGEIVYQLGAELRLLDLATLESRAVSVTIPGARPALRPRRVDAAEQIVSRSVSPNGKRVVVEARGDVWSLPAEHGSPRNLTRTSGAAERDPAYSPDARHVAFFADRSGAYELYLTTPGALEEPRRVTELEAGFLFGPTWSPDSARLTLWDEDGRLYLHDVAAETTREIARLPGNGRTRVSWSPDSRWLTWAAPEDVVRRDAVWLHDVTDGSTQRVTHGAFNDSWPVFDRAGDFLYFASQREFSRPRYEDVGTTWIYTDTDRLYAVPLRADVASPLLAESDEEDVDADDEDAAESPGDKREQKKKKKEKKKARSGDDDDGDDEDGDDDTPKPVTIDLDHFEARAIELPVERGNFGFLAVNDEGQLLFTRAPSSPLDGEPSIRLLDLDDDEEPEKTVLDGFGAFETTVDGAKLLALADGRAVLVEARPDQKAETTISTDGMIATIDPRAEWRQMFAEAWRLQRDFFYDPNLHGVDWEAVREQYAPLVEDCASRADLAFVIAEMISELNVGHAYSFGGDLDPAPSESVGLLGARFELHEGAYRIASLYEGAPWDVDARGPLSQPGLDAKPGDYLLAVNGTPVDADRDPWAALLGLAGATVTLTVSDRPALDDTAREVVVETLSSDADLVYRAWVERNRRYVAEESGGRIGYIYVPNTGTRGQDELVRQFYQQHHMDALIIDERWNGGGQVPTRFIELLDRPLANYWALRNGDTVPWPPDAHFGPKAMLINGQAGSGGDYFPFWFRERGLGPLIGMRTWGGLVGISGNPSLIDGGGVTVPRFAFYETDGTWGIEGHGVDPDIEIVDDPALMVDGGDPQLDAAIEHLMRELLVNPYLPVAPPAYPDRSGMGLPAQDR